MSSYATLARPYAQAAFDFASEADLLDRWEHALRFAARVADEDTVGRLIGDPRVGERVLVALFEPAEQSPRGFDNFIRLLERNGRLATLPDIAAQYAELKDAAERTLSVIVRAAAELDDDHRQRIERALAKRFGKNIELDVQVDQTLVGGASVKAGDLVIDGSVRSKIERLAATLTSH